MPTVLRHSKSNMRSLLLSVTPSSTVLLAENSLSDNRGANGKPTSNLLEKQGNWWQTVIPVTIQMSVESTQMVSTALLKFQCMEKSQRLSKTGDIGGFEDQFARIITKLPAPYRKKVWTRSLHMLLDSFKFLNIHRKQAMVLFQLHFSSFDSRCRLNSTQDVLLCRRQAGISYLKQEPGCTSVSSLR